MIQKRRITMTTDNTSHSLNTFAFLSEEVERALRLRAWKDEIFREALIANPKGVIQRLFPQCFPHGKLAEPLIIKVIEEDPNTCHIVVPFLSDEFPTPEIPEEEQLELLANMGLDRRIGTSDKRQLQSSEKTKEPDWLKDSFKRQQAEEAAKQQEAASKPLTREKFQKEILSLAKKDKAFFQNMLENPQKALQDYFPHYVNGSNGSEKQTIKVIQNTADTHHLVLPSSRDDFEGGGVPKEPEKRAPLDGCCVTCICASKNTN
jgi:hypothetical protein